MSSVTDQEFARLLRSMTIEYGLTFLTMFANKEHQDQLEREFVSSRKSCNGHQLRSVKHAKVSNKKVS